MMGLEATLPPLSMSVLSWPDGSFPSKEVTCEVPCPRWGTDRPSEAVCVYLASGLRTQTGGHIVMPYSVLFSVFLKSFPCVI